MSIDDNEGITFNNIWTYLTSTEVINATTFQPFFSFKIFKAKDLRALMLVRPAAAVNNGNPPEQDMQPKQRDADYYAMESARITNQLSEIKTPHPEMKPYVGEDRQAWNDKLFGFDGYKSGLAAEPTNTIPPQRIHTEDLAAGSPRRASYIALQELSEQLHRVPCYDLVIRGWNSAIQWFNTVSTKSQGSGAIADILSQARTADDYAWIDLMVAALDTLHNNEDVELDDVDEVFFVPSEYQDGDENVLGDDDAEDTDGDDTRQESEEEE